MSQTEVSSHCKSTETTREVSEGRSTLTVVGAQNEKGDLLMNGDGAEIRELKPRGKDRSTLITDRWGLIGPSEAREEEARINQQAMKRILETETRYSLPALEQAVSTVERGCRLLAMAGLADDPVREEELAAAIDRIADAVGSRDWM
jgi:hypothetical protein